MNASSDTTTTTGKMMVAAYRAARLSQRPVLRTSLHHSHVARRLARSAGQPAVELEQQAPPATATAAPIIASVPKPQDSGSVFANLVNISGAEQRIEASRGEVVEVASCCDDNVKPADPVEEIPGDQPDDTAEVVCQADPIEAATIPVPAGVAPYDPPLAEIGFGPGMLIRLSQLGLYTTADLADADAAKLRVDLGEISRLVDVEAWINSARRTAASSSR